MLLQVIVFFKPGPKRRVELFKSQGKCVEVDTSGSPNVYFEVCLPDNVKTSKLPGTVVIYPNPFKDFAVVKSADTDRIRSIEIIDLYGRAVRTIKNINDNVVTMHRGNLPGGIYFIRILAADTFVKKVIIQF